MSTPQVQVEIPEKVFFRIGEVARITDVKPYVLRFWESEFTSLKPGKSSSGQRRYRRSDIEQVLRIKELLWERKFTIAGARDELRTARARERTRLAGQQELPMAEPLEPDTSAALPSTEAPDPAGEVAKVVLVAVRRDLLALRERLRTLTEQS